MENITKPDDVINSIQNRLRDIVQDINNPERTKIVQVKVGESEISYGQSICSGQSIYHDIAALWTPRIINGLSTFKPRHNDVWLCAYPKSAVGILLSGELKNLTSFKEAQMIDLFQDMESCAKMPSPRILNTHLMATYMPPAIFETGKIIVIMRNPKSVAVSFFHHVQNISSYGFDGTFSEYLQHFLDTNHASLSTNVWGSWFDYVKLWWDMSKKQKNILVVFYEDAKKDPISTFKKLGHHLGVERSDEFYQKVAELSSFNSMVKHVGKNEAQAELLGRIIKEGRPGLIRKGVIRDWESHFTVAENERFDTFLSFTMKGYEDLMTKFQYE